MPDFMTRSGVACWWSIKNLIEQNPGNCYLWTLTFKEVWPDNYCSNMHRNLITAIKDEVKQGRWPADWGGVKVVEEHPGGHGLHFHWVIRGRIPINKLLQLGHRHGFGRIHVRQKPCDAGAASYLAKYLNKNDKIYNLKVWCCIGSYEGVKCKDVEFLAPSKKVFREAYQEAIAAGVGKAPAFNHAKKVQAKYIHEYDIRTTEGFIHSESVSQKQSGGVQ